MPNSRSSTSSEEPLSVDVLQTIIDDGDYRAVLHHLLSYVHRDGGHYTLLAGDATSVHEACYVIRELYRKNAALAARVGELSR